MIRKVKVLLVILFLFVFALKNYASAGIEDFLNPGGNSVKADCKFVGHADNFSSEYSLASAGDVDGDGYSDILIADNSSVSYPRKTYLFLGSSISKGIKGFPEADYCFDGEQGDDSTHQVAGAGDVDGDGLNDILISSTYYQSGIGKTWLILSSTLKEFQKGLYNLSDLADYSFTGENTWDFSGTSIAGAGDVDGDGFSDILIGAHFNDDNGSIAGKTYLIFGSIIKDLSKGVYNLGDVSYPILGENTGDGSGFSVASGGDVDGDGLSDILIGALWNEDNGINAGKTYLIFGKTVKEYPDGINLSDADYAFIGENKSDQSGFCVTSAGDVDGDKLDDIFIRSLGSFANDYGKTYIVFASTILKSSNKIIDLSDADYVFIGGYQGSLYHQIIASAGDMDSDGLSDILIGAPYDDKTYSFFGSTIKKSPKGVIDILDADCIFISEDPCDYSGTSVASAGDVNGDGLSDILIGGATCSGKIHLVYGKNNLGFEYGNLKYWELSGNIINSSKNAKVIETLAGAISPSEGKYMGFLSNVDKAQGEEVILYSPWFYIPDNADTIPFYEYSWNFLTNEKPSNNNIYNDVLVVKKEVEGGGISNIASLCVNKLPYPKKNVAGYKNATGWKKFTNKAFYDKGKRVRLHFILKNVGDNKNETAVLIDNIIIKTKKIFVGS